MFVEIRKQGKVRKQYLVHTYRVGGKVKRISRYLGSGLDAISLQKARIKAELHVLEQMKEKSAYAYELTPEDIKIYKKYDQNLKIEHLQNVDWERFTKEFTYNTNAIEGSTVAYKEVEALIEKKEPPQNDEEQETINMAGAIAYIKTTKESFSVPMILKLHELCFKGTKPFAGKLRTVDVVIRDAQGHIIHHGAPYKQVQKLLQELVGWYDKHKKKYPALLLAALVHNQFENIHPFQDGNGRVGRLLLNYVLLSHDHPPLNVRLTDRKQYYSRLHAFDQTGSILPTLKFLRAQYKKQYRGLRK
ncbi:MAG: Fic family protein [archaeon]